MTTPYTYLIKHIPTGKLYYGCRYAKGCHPTDLWTSYKTSSKLVHKLVEHYGDQSFVFEVRKTFNSVVAARVWETKVLKRMMVTKRKDFLNQTDNISISPEAASKARKGKVGIYHISEEQKECIRKANTGLKRSDEVKKKMSDAKKGRVARNKGIPHTDETRAKMSKSHSGKKQPASFGMKMSAFMTGKRLFVNSEGIRKFFTPGTEPSGFLPSNKNTGE